VCGWLKDKYGLSWQIVPSVVPDLLLGDDIDRRNRVIGAIMKMKKPDIESLKRAGSA